MFYVKNEAGEFVEASEHDIDELFREKSDKIISSKLAKAKEKQSDEIRAEITAKVQSEEREKIKTELRDEIESEWQKKLDVANTKNEELDVALRRKTIAAEYGFKPELENIWAPVPMRTCVRKLILSRVASTLAQSFGHQKKLLKKPAAVL